MEVSGRGRRDRRGRILRSRLTTELLDGGLVRANPALKLADLHVFEREDPLEFV